MPSPSGQDGCSSRRRGSRRGSEFRRRAARPAQRRHPRRCAPPCRAATSRRHKAIAPGVFGDAHNLVLARESAGHRPRSAPDRLLRRMPDWVTANTFSAMAYDDCSAPCLNPTAANARIELVHAGRAHRLRAVDERAQPTRGRMRPALPRRPPRHKLESEIRQPRQRAAILAIDLQHGLGMHHPVQRRLHHHRHVANHGQHEAGDQPHVVIQRQPAINAIARAVDVEHLAPGARAGAAPPHASAPRPSAIRWFRPNAG